MEIIINANRSFNLNCLKTVITVLFHNTPLNPYQHLDGSLCLPSYIFIPDEKEIVPSKQNALFSPLSEFDSYAIFSRYIALSIPMNDQRPSSTLLIKNKMIGRAAELEKLRNPIIDRNSHLLQPNFEEFSNIGD